MLPINWWHLYIDHIYHVHDIESNLIVFFLYEYPNVMNHVRQQQFEWKCINFYK